jgi:hypothetical protein
VKQEQLSSCSEKRNYSINFVSSFTTVLTGSQWLLMWTSSGFTPGIETDIDFHLLVKLGDGPMLL